MFWPIEDHLVYSMFWSIGNLVYSMFWSIGNLVYSMFWSIGNLVFSMFWPIGNLVFSMFWPIVYLVYSMFWPIEDIIRRFLFGFHPTVPKKRLRRKEIESAWTGEALIAIYSFFQDICPPLSLSSLLLRPKDIKDRN
jgi:hypothetical protein